MAVDDITTQYTLYLHCPIYCLGSNTLCLGVSHDKNDSIRLLDFTDYIISWSSLYVLNRDIYMINKLTNQSVVKCILQWKGYIAMNSYIMIFADFEIEWAHLSKIWRVQGQVNLHIRNLKCNINTERFQIRKSRNISVNACVIRP